MFWVWIGFEFDLCVLSLIMGGVGAALSMHQPAHGKTKARNNEHTHARASQHPSLTCDVTALPSSWKRLRSASRASLALAPPLPPAAPPPAPPPPPRAPLASAHASVWPGGRPCRRSASSIRSRPKRPLLSNRHMRSLEVVNVGTTSTPAAELPWLCVRWCVYDCVVFCVVVVVLCVCVCLACCVVVAVCLWLVRGLLQFAAARRSLPPRNLALPTPPNATQIPSRSHHNLMGSPRVAQIERTRAPRQDTHFPPTPLHKPNRKIHSPKAKTDPPVPGSPRVA